MTQTKLWNSRPENRTTGWLEQARELKDRMICLPLLEAQGLVYETSKLTEETVLLISSESALTFVNDFKNHQGPVVFQGPKASALAKKLGWKIDWVGRGTGVLELFQEAPIALKSKPWLQLGSAETQLPISEIEALGGRIEHCSVYKMQAHQKSLELWRTLPKKGAWIHFSGSAVRSLAKFRGTGLDDPFKFLQICWGKSAVKECQKLNASYLYLDPAQGSEVWIPQILEGLESI